MNITAEDSRCRQWLERMTAFLNAEYGLPPTAGRLLSWLMICDPPEQTSADLAAAIDVSPAGISANMRLLTDAKFVSRRGRPGSRTQVYRIEDDAWEAVVRQRVASLTAFRDLVSVGIDLVGDPVTASRLRSAHDVYDWMARALTSTPMPSTLRRDE